MAIKMGKTEDEIRAMRERNGSLLNNISDRYDVVKMHDKYADKVASIDPNTLSPEKDKKKAEEKIDNFIENEKEKIVSIPLSKLSQSPKNTFNPMTGERWEEFLASLKARGQITPIIVRPKSCIEFYQDQVENEFEILVGNTRYAGLKEIGAEAANAIIVECNDVDATILISQSNIQRENVSEIEVARAYKNTYDAMKQSKGGNDKVQKGKDFSLLKRDGFENAEALENTEVSPKVQNEPLVDTAALVAEKYGISKSTLKRKMALANCIDDVVDMYRKKKLTQNQIQDISRASIYAQESMVEVLKKEKLSMTDEIAKEIKKASKEQEDYVFQYGEFPLNTMRKIIHEGQPDDKDELKAKAAKKTEKVNKMKAKEGLYRISNSVFPKDVTTIEDREKWLSKAAAVYIKYQQEYNFDE